MNDLRPELCRFLEAVAPARHGYADRRQKRILSELMPIYATEAARIGIHESYRLRLAHFTAQLAHESAGFTTTREFHDGTNYEGRKDLGNTQQGDGKRYRGRGLMQTTGRANYRDAAAGIRRLRPDAPDFETHPEELERFPWALLSATHYWQSRGLNRWADADNLRAVTRRINGGYNGLADRQRYLHKAKAWLGDQPRDHLTWVVSLTERSKDLFDRFIG